MKNTLITLMIAAGASFAFGHGEVEVGPNDGRILEFSKNETMHGEVTKKDGKLHIAVLDKEMKPVAVDAQILTATAGTRAKPVKLDVEKVDGGFLINEPGAGEWLIVQFKESADAAPITARMNYDIRECAPCKSPEWRCQCAKK